MPAHAPSTESTDEGMPRASFGQPTSVFMPVAPHQLAEPELVGLDHVALGLLGLQSAKNPRSGSRASTPPRKPSR